MKVIWNILSFKLRAFFFVVECCRNESQILKSHLFGIWKIWKEKKLIYFYYYYLFFFLHQNEWMNENEVIVKNTSY